MNYKVEFHPNFEKQLKNMNEEELKLVLLAIEKIKRNPYIGTEIEASPFERFKNKCKYLKRELELVIKWNMSK